MSGGDWEEFSKYSNGQDRRAEGVANEDDEFGDFEGFEDVEQLGLHMAQPLPEALQATWASFPDYVPSQTASSQARHPDLLPQAAMHTSMLTESSSSLNNSDFDLPDRNNHGSNVIGLNQDADGSIPDVHELPDISSPDRVPPDLAVADVQRSTSNPLPDVSPQGSSHLELVSGSLPDVSPPQFQCSLPDVSPSSSNQMVHHSTLPDISPSSNLHLACNFPDISPPSGNLNQPDLSNICHLNKQHPDLAEVSQSLSHKLCLNENENASFIAELPSAIPPCCSNSSSQSGIIGNVVRPSESLGARQKTTTVTSSIEPNSVPSDFRQEEFVEIATMRQQMNTLLDQNQRLIMETKSLQSQNAALVQGLSDCISLIHGQEARLQELLESKVNELRTDLTASVDNLIITQQETIQQKVNEQETIISEMKNVQGNLKEEVIENLNALKTENEAIMSAQLQSLQNNLREDLQKLFQNVSSDGIKKQLNHHGEDSVETIVTTFKSYMKEQHEKEEQSRLAMVTFLDTLLSSTKEQLLTFQDPGKKS